MQLSDTIARNSGQSWHSGTKSNNVASSLSSRYSPLFFFYASWASIGCIFGSYFNVRNGILAIGAIHMLEKGYHIGVCLTSSKKKVFASHGWRFNNRNYASWKFMFILLGYVIVSTNWHLVHLI